MAAAGGIPFYYEKLVVLVLNIRRVNAEAVEDGSLHEGLNLVAPLRQEHEQRGQDEQSHHVEHQRLLVESVQDKQNRPDDEQHESHDAQQLVQLDALLQERREETFK